MADTRSLTQRNEDETRGLLVGRPSWLLLELWEITEANREDLRRAGSSYGEHASANLIGWIIDEMARRHPQVLGHWHDLQAQGLDVDLAAMFRDEL